MRYDRPPRHPAVWTDTPEGRIYELEVWLSAEEIAVLTGGQLMPQTRCSYEPFMRVLEGREFVTWAGIDIVSDDDGA